MEKAAIGPRIVSGRTYYGAYLRGTAFKLPGLTCSEDCVGKSHLAISLVLVTFSFRQEVSHSPSNPLIANKQNIYFYMDIRIIFAFIKCNQPSHKVQ